MDQDHIVLLVIGLVAVVGIGAMLFAGNQLSLGSVDSLGQAAATAKNNWLAQGDTFTLASQGTTVYTYNGYDPLQSTVLFTVQGNDVNSVYSTPNTNNIAAFKLIAGGIDNAGKLDLSMGTVTIIGATKQTVAVCIPDGQKDDVLGKTHCCSEQAVKGSTLCTNWADYGTTWTSCTNLCGVTGVTAAACPYGPTGTTLCPCPAGQTSNGQLGRNVCKPIPRNQTNSTCKDSDSGLNYLTSGMTSGLKNGVQYSTKDWCLSSTQLREQYCNGTVEMNTTVYCSNEIKLGICSQDYTTGTPGFCKTSCGDGYCDSTVSGENAVNCPADCTPVQIPPSCTDSDGGINPTIMGYVNVTFNGTGAVYWDTCESNSTLKEYYCNGAAPSGKQIDCISNQTHSCGNGYCY